MLARLNVPFVMAVPTAVTDYSRYRTMSRVAFSAGQAARGLTNAITYYKWTQIAFIYDVANVAYMAPFYKQFSGKVVLGSGLGIFRREHPCEQHRAGE